MSLIIILTLFLIYVYGLVSIFGSINIYSEKDADGLKGKLLKFGYKYSVYWTNFVGLSLTALLQLSPLYIVSFYFAAGCVLMSLCYTVAVKWFGDTKWAEISWGFCWGCLMLATFLL